jgi:hypothetical protein
MSWEGLGKQRTALGTWLDNSPYNQRDLEIVSGVNKNTISKACNDSRYFPRHDVAKRILDAIRKIDPDAKMSDFWDM